MQAVTTKYLSATNTRGSRIKAACWRGSVTIGYPHEHSGEDAHKQAAIKLLASFDKDQHPKDVKWSGAALIGCSTGDNSGYTFLVVQPYNLGEIDSLLAPLRTGGRG